MLNGIAKGLPCTCAGRLFTKTLHVSLVHRNTVFKTVRRALPIMSFTATPAGRQAMVSNTNELRGERAQEGGVVRNVAAAPTVKRRASQREPRADSSRQPLCAVRAARHGATTRRRRLGQRQRAHSHAHSGSRRGQGRFGCGAAPISRTLALCPTVYWAMASVPWLTSETVGRSVTPRCSATARVATARSSSSPLAFHPASLGCRVPPMKTVSRVGGRLPAATPACCGNVHESQVMPSTCRRPRNHASGREPDRNHQTGVRGRGGGEGVRRR